MSNPSSDSKLFRIYTVTPDNRTSKQYLTDLENRIVNYPFDGYLIPNGNPGFGTGPLSVGSVARVSDVRERRDRANFPAPAKVLDVSEVDKAQVGLVFNPPIIRIYHLANESGASVVATNNENLVYNMPSPLGLFNIDSNSFTDELLDLDTNVSIRPVFGGRYRLNRFSVQNVRKISFQDYKTLQRTFKQEVEEAQEALDAISRNYGQRIFEHEMVIKALARERDAAIRNAGHPPCLDEILFRAFKTGEEE